MGALTGCPVYVVHLSTRLGLERIRAAQAQGQRVWTETCPQYLLLTEAEMARWGPFAKIGPPLRLVILLSQVVPLRNRCAPLFVRVDLDVVIANLRGWE